MNLFPTSLEHFWNDISIFEENYNDFHFQGVCSFTDLKFSMI